MKRPKKPKATLNTERDVIYFINDEVIRMHHFVDMGQYTDKEIAEMLKWCRDTLLVNHWKFTGGWPGTFHFLNASDLTMFTLKWITR